MQSIAKIGTQSTMKSSKKRCKNSRLKSPKPVEREREYRLHPDVYYKESSEKNIPGAQKKRKEKNRRISLRPRSEEASNNISITLMQGITKIGSHRSMKNHRRALHELTK
jgi:hypothetical protein